MNDNCPICSARLTSHRENLGGKDATFYDCPRCGQFQLSGSLVASLPELKSRDAEAWAKLSHAIRRSQGRSESVVWNTYSVIAVLKNPLPRPREQADLLLRWIAENVSGPGEDVDVRFETHGSIIGSKTQSGFALIIDHLFSSGLITGHSLATLAGSGRALATPTFAGWEYYEQLRQGRAEYRKAFMAMKFGDTLLNNMLETAFKPAAKKAGFELSKLDDNPIAGLIDDRLRVEIQSSAFMVADLTHDNFGAYWEAGYAEGLGKPVIYTCEKGKFESSKTHFDTNHHLTICWIDSEPEAAASSLLATIRATLPHLAILVDVDN